MKYILLFTLLFASLFAEEKKEKVTIGAGPYIQTQPYKGVEDILVPSPVFFFDNSLFYVRWTRFGMYFLGDKGEEFSWAFSLTAQPRTFGYKTKNVSYLQGMTDRETSLEGGLAFSALYKDANLELLALTDILGRPDLWVYTLNIGYEYALGKTTFYPSFGATYQSDKFVNYYYGVNPSETALTRPLYTPKGGTLLTAQTYINYALTQSYDILFNARADFMPPSATNSPIVAENVIYSGMISLLYTFEY